MAATIITLTVHQLARMIVRRGDLAESLTQDLTDEERDWVEGEIGALDCLIDPARQRSGEVVILPFTG